MKHRIEKDHLGEIKIDESSYWGAQTERALINFKLSGYKTSRRFLKALAMVKKACCLANRELDFIPAEKSTAILQACDEIISGKFDSQFKLDALQGGAGTSTNMNMNEVVANRALEILGKAKGDYHEIHPIDTINLHQSTNDVYPTALKTAAIFALRDLSKESSELQGAFQLKEKEFGDITTIGRTELQDAVPMTLGSQFASFADAIARDRWRTFKSEERLRMVNIGGTAIGTGITAPRNYIFSVIEKLRQVTGLGLARAENPIDNTANADVYVEVSGMLDAFAVNLIKIANDLRLLHYFEEINLPAVQAGSSIMPGKVNPVIIESVITCGFKVSSNHQLLSRCASDGTLQINEFMPLIAFTLLESLEMLINTCITLTKHVKNIEAHRENCKLHFEHNLMIVTAFIPHIGYEKAEQLVDKYKSEGKTSFRKFLEIELGTELVDKVLSPYNLMALGHK